MVREQDAQGCPKDGVKAEKQLMGQAGHGKRGLRQLPTCGLYGYRHVLAYGYVFGLAQQVQTGGHDWHEEQDCQNRQSPGPE
jgi:hypothetical protein